MAKFAYGGKVVTIHGHHKMDKVFCSLYANCGWTLVWKLEIFCELNGGVSNIRFLDFGLETG